MGLIRIIQDSNRNAQLKKMNKLKQQELNHQRQQQQIYICPVCRRVIPMDANICPYCGKDFSSTQQTKHKFCSECGAELEFNSKFCGQRGKKV